MTSPEMTAADVLREARRLIQKKGWCQGHYAATADGSCCPPRANEAAQFCMVGALRCITEDDTGNIKVLSLFNGPYELLRKATRYYGEPHKWNDHPGRTREEVIAVFDKAIALASAGDLP